MISTDMAESYFCTASGIRFTPFSPREDDITIGDIAHGLSGVNRFGGHHHGPWYSVSEHSVLVSRMVANEHALQALLHDASEGMGLVDVLSPVKRFLPDYRAAEAVLQAAIYRKFRLPTIEHPSVKAADYRLLSYEQKILGPNVPWLREALAARGHEPLPEGSIKCWDPATARIRFLDRFTELTHARAA